jgi:GH15 family glucan-1,4-alpha-glucosidase
LEDYALIGDCHTAALISRQGSVDWLCLPHFDSPACFAALLGNDDNGRWLLSPDCEIKKITRAYRQASLVLETTFETEAGTVAIVDCMTPRDKTPNLFRLVIGKSGSVPMKMELAIRFDYGSIVPWVNRTKEGLSAIAGPDTVLLRTPVELKGENFKTTSQFVVKGGQNIPFDFTWCASYHDYPKILDVAREIERTDAWWKKWAGRCRYAGEWHEEVLRSLITLKALTFSPTGAIVAAPTTSIPESIGGVRNWDYRFCWVRDATLSLYALVNAGYIEEARAWREWLIRAVAGKPSELNIVYGLRGERRLTELELPWLSGYDNSRPVRIGNAACKQVQLDVYGEIADTLYVCRLSGLEPNSDKPDAVAAALLEHLEGAWREPDEGIWEVRGPRRQFTHSKVMAWVAMDRAIKSAERGWIDGPIENWRKLREEIHRDVCKNGFDTELNSFVQFYGGKHLDASLLMIAIVGFLPASDARVRGTVDAIERRLLSHDGFVNRYTMDSAVDGLPHGEGAFLPCTLWLADNYALQGRNDDARRIFQRVLSVRNDLGLLSEQYDTERRRLVGNFPQAFSHFGLVNTATLLTAKLAASESS